MGGSIAPDNRELLEHIARYLLRAPVSLERMWYNPEAGTITIRPLAGEGNAPVELEALDFISRLVLHIPDVRERQVTYYGSYANASRLRRLKRASCGANVGFVPLSELEEPTPFEMQRKIRWAQLIKQVWLEDPLLCPECKGEMRIISFITDPPVVDKILRHIQWHPGDPLIPYIRPPPEMLKVAESSLNS